jgi:hypothetical protein
MVCLRCTGILLAALLAARGAEAATPERGDIDADGAVTITDGIAVLNFLFISAPAPYCMPVADANGDGDVNISDPVRVLNHLFHGAGDLPELDEGEVDACTSSSLPPSIPERPTYRAYPGFPIDLAVGAVDPEGERLRYEAPELPHGASLDPDTGVFRWMPAASDVGLVYVVCTVIDGGLPPNRVEGRLVFEVLSPDPCDRPVCNPALGCDPMPIEDLATDCCGDPGPRVPDPAGGCPEGSVLHVGRNSARATTVGRLQGCDGLRVAPLAQGGAGVHLNFEMRCLDPDEVIIHVRLETATMVLVDSQRLTFFDERADGYLEKRSMGFSADDQSFPEGTEGRLTVTVRDGSGAELVRRVRVVLTAQPLPDLP